MWQIMGIGHLQPAAESEEDRIRRIARDEFNRMLEEMAETALAHLRELDA